MARLLDGLYVGSLDDVQCRRKLAALSISHVLTVDQRPLDAAYRQGLTAYLHVPLLDEDTEDALSKLEVCFEFIEEGRQAATGGVIVHCHAGVSRSVTVAAAYLMTKLQMGLEDTLAYIKKFKPDARPNDGFLSQLDLLEQMNCCMDRDHPLYKAFRLQTVARMITGHGDTSSLKDLFLTGSHTEAGKGTSAYKCKKCRTVLFMDTAVLRHKRGKGVAAFATSKASAAAAAAAAATQSRLRSNGTLAADEEGQWCCDIHSVFIEPVRWMERHISELQGKIMCPKCDVKIGTWSWTGDTCTCGRWVTPSFLIHMSKVDYRNVPCPSAPVVQAKLPQPVSSSRSDALLVSNVTEVGQHEIQK